jgi:hypothetical protein
MSLIMSMSSPLPLIILLPTCLMLNCLFNPASVRLGFRLAYLLSLSPLLSIIVSKVASRSLMSLLVLFFSFLFFFVRGFTWTHSIWRCDFKIKGCPCGFWYPLSCFVHRPSFVLHCFPLSMFSKSTCS